MIAELMFRREQTIRKRSELTMDAANPHKVSLLRPRQSDVKMSQLVRGEHSHMVNECV